MRYIIDIETNKLLADSITYKSFPYRLNKEAKLWCICIYNVDTHIIKKAIKEEITKEWLKNALTDCTELIGHNTIKFDFPLLQLFGVLDYTVGYLNQRDTVFNREVKITDTLILSRLAYPDRYGGHSLKSWGERTEQPKVDFRQICIDRGYINKNASHGAEFDSYVSEMVTYCIGDVVTNALTFLSLKREMGKWDWEQAIKLENKLADKAIRRELLGFWFDKDLAIKCLEDLNIKMDIIKAIVEPILPPKPMNKGELKEYTLPIRQFDKKGDYSSYLIKFCFKHRAILVDNKIIFENKEFDLPYINPLKTHLPAIIDNLDHIKMHLINLGWFPLEWRERDLTKDSKKQSISYEKRIKALYKWYDETIAGKYTEERFNQLEIPRNEILNVYSVLLREDKPVRVPTSPSIRVGLEKELCPNLVALGDKVAFARDFADYLTYKHRRNSIAGGDTEDMDFDNEIPNTGYLAQYREEDGRIPTPSIEIGASTSRYVHKFVANIPRATSIYGKEMRSLFGCGKNAFQLGFDFSSLENRILGHYVFNYKDGDILAEQMLAEKPNDFHSLQAIKLGISRGDVKSLNYGILYGAQIKKITKMLSCSENRAKELYNGFWEGAPALLELREKIETYWESTNRRYILGIDGRKIFIRSKHSILNALFQSAGVIATKYTTISIYEALEKQGLCTDPLIGKPDFCSMIEYHDELAAYINPKLIKFEIFITEDDAKEFIKNWKKEKLGTITKGNNCYYIVLPNIISNTINDSIQKISKLLKLNINLGFEYTVGSTWYSTH